MKNIPSKETIRRQTIRNMKRLGTHDVGFNRLIGIYADTLHQYYFLEREWEKDGYKTFVVSGQNSVKKSPILEQLNTLKKDVITYSDRLMLNPRAYGEGAPDEGENPLANFLKSNGM